MTATIAQLLALNERLQASSDSATVDVEYLLCHCLGKERSYLRAWPEAEVDPDAERLFLQLLERRQAGEPVAYLIGRCGFWTLDLQVTKATLIPRPDTELLVEQALNTMNGREPISVLDLGTGTGAIALALASEKPEWRVTACDLQPDAVALAKQNRDRLALDRVTILQSDWFSELAGARFDLIVSNPPYIDELDPHLTQGDVRFEPHSALVAAANGYADIDRIIRGSVMHLHEGGWLLFEHGYNQGEGARERLAAAGFEQVMTVRDLAGHERVSAGRAPA